MRDPRLKTNLRDNAVIILQTQGETQDIVGISLKI